MIQIHDIDELQTLLDYPTQYVSVQQDVNLNMDESEALAVLQILSLQ